MKTIPGAEDINVRIGDRFHYPVTVPGNGLLIRPNFYFHPQLFEFIK